MTLRLYNTLTNQLEDFQPLDPAGKVVRLYSCGPTVYSYAQIGNFRTNLMVDLLRRTLEYFGYEVQHVMNITDVGHLTQDDIDEGDDKMQVAAQRENKTIWEIADYYTDAFVKDMERLHMRMPHELPRATGHLPEMIAQIETLIEAGHAYVVDGEVYYDVTSFSAYGNLSNNRLEDLMAGARVEVHGSKHNPADFALWKKDENHLMQWDSPWGRGFPGWHIECSAMSMKYLGEQLDIHTGGEDNIFPHHECEIAQAEGATRKPFVKYWVHARHLLVDGKKMSKSLGNYYTLQDLIDKGYSPRAFRYLMITTSFTQNINFTLDSLQAAEEALRRIDDFVFSLQHASGSTDDVSALLSATEKRLRECLADNLNSAGAIAAVFDMIRDINKADVSAVAAKAILAAMQEYDEVFGFLFWSDEDASDISDEDKALIQERDEAREQKNWARSDEIRDTLKARGIVVLDRPGGAIWKWES